MIAVTGNGFTIKEKIFIAIAWLPKATVQVGGIPLAIMHNSLVPLTVLMVSCAGCCRLYSSWRSPGEECRWRVSASWEDGESWSAWEKCATVHPQLSKPRLSGEPSIIRWTFNYPTNLQLSKLTKLVNFHEFHYNLQAGGHLVMWSVFQPPAVCYICTCFLHTNSIHASANARSTERV